MGNTRDGWIENLKKWYPDGNQLIELVIWSEDDIDIKIRQAFGDGAADRFLGLPRETKDKITDRLFDHFSDFEDPNGDSLDYVVGKYYKEILKEEESEYQRWLDRGKNGCKEA